MLSHLNMVTNYSAVTGIACDLELQ